MRNNRLLGVVSEKVALTGSTGLTVFSISTYMYPEPVIIQMKILCTVKAAVLEARVFADIPAKVNSPIS